MLCIKCSSEIPDGSAYCNICGKAQTATRSAKKRGNGQGTVYKQPSGSWTAEVTLGWSIENGHRRRIVRKKSGFKTKKAALEHINALFRAPESKSVITLSELWELFQRELSALSASKQTAYKIAWKKIKDDVAYRTIDTFSVPELQELIDISAPSYYTRRDIKTLLSHLYKIAIRDDFVDKNRTEYIKLPKLVSTEREVFAPADVRALWRDFREPSTVTACMLTMLYTGIRPGELLTIRAENVHTDEHYMTGGIKTTKGKNRKIIIPDKLLPVIGYLLNTSAEGLLAYYKNDNDFYDDWKEKRSELGLSEQLTPYCCRHTYITNLTALKVSPAMLQELAGHEDYDTTLEYTHLSINDRLREVNRLS